MAATSQNRRGSAYFRLTRWITALAALLLPARRTGGKAALIEQVDRVPIADQRMLSRGIVSAPAPIQGPLTRVSNPRLFLRMLAAEGTAVRRVRAISTPLTAAERAGVIVLDERRRSFARRRSAAYAGATIPTGRGEHR